MSQPELDPGLATIGLPALDAAAALRERVDRKFVLERGRLPDLLAALAETHAVLEIDGLRRFGYRSTYFDTPQLRSYRDHLQGRRRRYKTRRREYLDSGAGALEVKLKGSRGRTLKHRAPWPEAGDDAPSCEALRFVDAVLAEAYGLPGPESLARAVVVDYERITLVDAQEGERVTCDLGLRFTGAGERAGRMHEELVVVETKSRGGADPANARLRQLGARPVDSLSKYLAGIALTRDDVPTNPLRPLLRRWFEPCA